MFSPIPSLEDLCSLGETDDVADADAIGEFGGMSARARTRKPLTAEVEPHMIDHNPFRSWCRFFGHGCGEGLIITERKLKTTSKLL